MDARSYHYSDNSGLAVTTAALAVEQPIARRVTASARGVVDHIRLQREPLDVEHQAGNQSTGHHHADMVTSASAFAGDGEVAEKVRIEGVLGLAVEGEIGEKPVEARLSARAGAEPDHDARSITLAVKTELFERNTTLSGFVGLGSDTVSPVEAPPGQKDRWPATHRRLTGGFAVSQLLTPRLVASGGAGLTLQRGTLENPYRRAIVRTSLFPEAVPDARDRVTGFLGLSWAMGHGLALHLRHGFYIDSWGVLAGIPEVGLAAALGSRLLVAGRYRFYRQTAADFYQPRYDDLEPILTGDARLGAIHEHLAGVEVRWTLAGDRGGFGAVTVLAGYELSLLEYERIATDTIVAHVPTAGVSICY